MQTLIGLKRLADAKRRLMPELTSGQRRALMLAMIESVVAAAREAALGPVALATSEPSAPSLARRLGVRALSDGDLPWNEGLVHALGGIEPEPAAVLYLAGDLPLLRAADLLGLASASPECGVTVARARDGGTNALLVRPARAIHPAFGAPGSAEVHGQAARKLGLACTVVDLPGLALDVDTIEDARDAGLVPRPLNGRGRAPVPG